MTKTTMKCVDTFINEYKQDENIQDYPIRIKGSKSLEVIQLEVTTLCSKVRHKQFDLPRLNREGEGTRVTHMLPVCQENVTKCHCFGGREG